MTYLQTTAFDLLNEPHLGLQNLESTEVDDTLNRSLTKPEIMILISLKIIFG